MEHDHSNLSDISGNLYNKNLVEWQAIVWYSLLKIDTNRWDPSNTEAVDANLELKK